MSEPTHAAVQALLDATDPLEKLDELSVLSANDLGQLLHLALYLLHIVDLEMDLRDLELGLNFVNRKDVRDR